MEAQMVYEIRDFSFLQTPLIVREIVIINPR